MKLVPLDRQRLEEHDVTLVKEGWLECDKCGATWPVPQHGGRRDYWKCSSNCADPEADERDKILHICFECYNAILDHLFVAEEEVVKEEIAELAAMLEPYLEADYRFRSLKYWCDDELKSWEKQEAKDETGTVQ